MKLNEAESEYIFTNDNNINIVFIRNTPKDENIDIKKFLDGMNMSKLLNKCNSNININILLIENILYEDSVKEESGTEGMNFDDDKKVIQNNNSNINFMIIKNILPSGSK